MAHLNDHGGIAGCFLISSFMDGSKFPSLGHIPLFQGPFTASRSCGKGKNGILKLRFLSHTAGNFTLQIVVWSGSHDRGFPRDPKPPGWDFPPSHCQ